ncbi:MAG: trigger factor [Xanthomonadales bacterium]|jgi:trigger factor|nr:trigger factor [Xanthomonadales bacterium]
MQVTVENSGGLQRRLTVQIPAGEVRGKIDERLREIGKTARLKGFRPGRVPMTVLKQRYGAGVRNEVLGQTMQSSLYDAIRQESLKPAGNPVIESVPELKGDEDLEFTATIEVYPEFGDIDASSLELTAPETEVTDSDIDEMLETLREQRAEWVDVEREPKAGDQVLFEYAAETKDGRVPEEGMSLLSIAVGESGFDDLEKALAKLVPGSVEEVKLTYPEQFNVAELAGKKARTTLKLDTVREKKLPELDEEFVKSFAVESGDIDEMRKEVRANLERELKGARLTYLKTQFLNRLMDAHPDVEVPESLVHAEAQQLQAQFAQQRGQEPDAANLEPFMDISRRRVKAGLLIGEIARQHDITVDGDRVRQAIETVAETYEQSQEVVQMYYNNPDMLRAIESNVLEEQVVDWALETAKVKTQPMAFKELINAAAEARQGL